MAMAGFYGGCVAEVISVNDRHFYAAALALNALQTRMGRVKASSLQSYGLKLEDRNFWWRTVCRFCT